MPDLGHVALVYKGPEAIENWRKDNPTEILNLEKACFNGIWLFRADLSGANLKEAIFERTNLADANLTGCNLCGANFSDAVLARANLTDIYGTNAIFMNSNLMQTNLKGSNLSKSNFLGACMIQSDLSNVNLSGANMNFSDLALAKLSNTDLTNASLLKANFFATEMDKTNLKNADLAGAMFSITKFNQVYVGGSKITHTIFTKVNLNELLGIKEIIHLGPSFVDYSTVYSSFTKNDNVFSEDLESFLLKSGMPPELLKEFPKILATKKYCDGFVCYGHPDVKFAEKMVSDLRNRGVVCWVYSLDSTVGASTWKEIKSYRERAEKMIVLCSSAALVRDGVLKEIEEQIDEDPEKIIPISLDELWKHEGFPVRRGSNNLKPFLLKKNYADFSNPKNYQKMLIKLLKGLEKKTLC